MWNIDFARHPRARRYVIRVRPDGHVRVTVPRWGSKREAALFVEQQRGWIERQRQRIRARAQETPQQPQLSPEEVRLLKQRARRELPAQLFAQAATLGLSVARVSIRNQKSRWGSCSPSGHICLNWRLVAFPEAVREYVIIHELMHLKRLDHSRAFWKLVAGACPDYEASRRWLRTHGALYSSHPTIG